MNPSDRSARRWFWYASQTADCVPLDSDAYASTTFDGEVIPFPDWACKAPDGGVHMNAELLRIDVSVAAPPNSRDEINWTCQYSVRLVAHSWLDKIRNLVDERRIGIGAIYFNGKVMDGWSTLHERRPPPLLATEGRAIACPLCGDSYTVLHGREYFSDPTVIGRPFIVNRNGLFVREDIALSRNLRTPRGVFEPWIVEYEPHPA